MFIASHFAKTATTSKSAIKKDSYGGYAIGDMITVKEEVECYYYNYPSGRNLVKFMPGDQAQLVGFPFKVRDFSKDGFPVFAMFDAKGQRFGCSIRNLKKIKK